MWVRSTQSKAAQKSSNTRGSNEASIKGQYDVIVDLENCGFCRVISTKTGFGGSK